MPDFDWVTKRHECSLLCIFERLLAGIKRDIVIRNELDGARHLLTVEYHGGCSVVREGGKRAVVRFTRESDHILISSEDGAIRMKVTYTLNRDGECRMVVGGEESEDWHVRNMAMERLFFS